MLNDQGTIINNPTTTATSKIEQIKRMMSIVNSSGNPDKMLEMMASNNPDLKAIMETVKASNGDAKSLFYQMARSKGMSDSDIDQFVNALLQIK